MHTSSYNGKCPLPHAGEIEGQDKLGDGNIASHTVSLRAGRSSKGGGAKALQLCSIRANPSDN